MTALAPPASRPPEKGAIPTVARLFLLLWSASTLFLSIAQPGSGLGPNDPKELEAFIDGIFGVVMKEQHIPGAVFVYVKDGAIFLSKGYGYADVEKRTPVLPGRTLFRVASVSKLFNATAVMQLVEQGRLDLAADVNSYVTRPQLDATFPGPVTLAHLLTHTAGLDERSIGMAARTKTEQRPLGEYLAERMPPRVMPAGDNVSYSNHGTALAGYIVQIVSGVPFSEYMDAHVFRPLGMEHSSFDLPDDRAGDLAMGYRIEAGMPVPVPYDYLQIPPAGGLATTGEDMARFMIAHLQRGRFGEMRILEEATAEEMHRLRFKHHPRLTGGIAIGFFVDERNGMRALVHGGDLPGFASLLALFPDRGVGYFVSCNADDATLRTKLADQLTERYFPKLEVKTPDPPADFASRAGRFVGRYRYNRYSRTSIEKVITLMQETTIKHDGKGMLVLLRDDEPHRFVEIEPLVFQDVQQGTIVAFREDANGVITHFMLNQGIFEKLPWWEQSWFHFGYIAIALAVYAVAIAVWPIAAGIAWLRGRTGRGGKWIGALGWFVAALNTFCLVYLAVTLAGMNQTEFTYGIPAQIRYILYIPPGAAGGAALLAPLTLYALARGRGSRWFRAHLGVVALCAAAFVPFCLHWNLLGLR
jgi:CubicO group peptidase (beta-lactamase class C family)